MKRFSAIGLAAFCLSGAAYSQVNVSAGFFAPNDSAVKDIFGTNTISYGFGLGPADRNGRAGAGFDLAALSLSASNNRFLMIGATYGFEVQSGRTPGSNTFTFARAGAGFGYYDFDLNGPLATGGGRYVRPLTAVEAGFVFNRQLTISAQYLLMPDAGSLNFSGMRVQAVLSLGR